MREPNHIYTFKIKDNSKTLHIFKYYFCKKTSTLTWLPKMYVKQANCFSKKSNINQNAIHYHHHHQHVCLVIFCAQFYVGHAGSITF